MDLKESEVLGAEIESHWYYGAKAKAMLDFLRPLAPQTILDVGAGSGFFTQYLLSRTVASEGWCVDIHYKEDRDTQAHTKKVYWRRSIDQSNADVVLLMDVLEHVDDDVGLLKEYIEKVPSGCLFLMTVPAFQWLWSSHDVFLDHKRRYTLRQLEKTVQKAGLKLHKSVYYFGFVFPLAAFLRFLDRGHLKASSQSQLKRHHPLVNWMLSRVCALERLFMAKNRLAGLTVFCLAQKI